MVCTSCAEAITDNGGDHLTVNEVAALCKEMGDEVCDHDCDGREDGFYNKCECSCNGTIPPITSIPNLDMTVGAVLEHKRQRFNT